MTRQSLPPVGNLDEAGSGVCCIEKHGWLRVALAVRALSIHLFETRKPTFKTGGERSPRAYSSRTKAMHLVCVAGRKKSAYPILRTRSG